MMIYLKIQIKLGGELYHFNDTDKLYYTRIKNGRLL